MPSKSINNLINAFLKWFDRQVLLIVNTLINCSAGVSFQNTTCRSICLWTSRCLMFSLSSDPSFDFGILWCLLVRHMFFVYVVKLFENKCSKRSSNRHFSFNISFRASVSCAINASTCSLFFGSSIVFDL